MLFPVLAQKAYLRNLQYRGSHALNTVASAIFGFIAIGIWKGIGADHPLGSYGVGGMIDYVAFNQACLWLTAFMTQGLGIPASVRSGQIALDMIRPVHLYYMLMSHEWGQLLYQLLYKVVPIYLFYLIVFGMYVPLDAQTVALTAIALAGAAYIAVSIQYLIGMAALWTTETNWIINLNFSVES